MNTKNENETLMNSCQSESEQAKPATGVQEWATGSLNFQLGCNRGCRYCYAQAMSVRMKRSTPESWLTPVIDKAKVHKRRRKIEGRTMFPTSHDVSRENLADSITVLHSLLDAGTNVLIVSKPELYCIRRLCEEFADRKSQILFRFTIGSTDNSVLKFWEPGATPFEERLDALRHAFEQGFETSVSVEPMLDLAVGKVIAATKPFVTDAIWLGRANRLMPTLGLNCPGNEEIKAAGRRLLAEQTDDWLRELYARYKDDPKVKFKDSIKRAVGLELQTVAGMDV